MYQELVSAKRIVDGEEVSREAEFPFPETLDESIALWSEQFGSKTPEDDVLKAIHAQLRLRYQAQLRATIVSRAEQEERARKRLEALRDAGMSPEEIIKLLKSLG